jgi:DNA-binding response OmpR family regulator
MKILICEDDVVLLKMLELRLQEDIKGEIVVARNGRVALELLRHHDFDLVITDIHMPHHNGEEVLNLLRLEQRKSTPIIMMSSDGDEDVIMHAKKMGVNEFVKKPINQYEISDQVRRMLKV